MTTKIEKGNPKALDLESIRFINNKVTVGFKCPAAIKLRLAQKAHLQGLTLSEYIGNLVKHSDRVDRGAKLDKNKEIDLLTRKVKEQREVIDFYENDKLKSLLKSYKHQTVVYHSQKNEPVKLQIKDLRSVYTVIINSFKIKS